MKNFLIGAAVVAFVALGAFYLTRPPLGASSGPDHYNAEKFYQGLTLSGTVTLGTGATSTLTATQVCSNSSFLRNPATAGSSTTLPSAINLGSACLGNTGDVKEIVLFNNSATAASTTIIATADASTTLRLGSSGAATSTVTLNGLNGAKLLIIKTAADTMTVFVSSFIAP